MGVNAREVESLGVTFANEEEHHSDATSALIEGTAGIEFAGEAEKACAAKPEAFG